MCIRDRFSTGTAANANGATRNDFDLFPERLFNSFTLSQDSEVSSISFAGNYNGQPFPSRDIFDIEIFSGNDGLPDFINTRSENFIRQQISLDEPLGGGFGDFEIDLGSFPILLEAGTYWITIVGGQDVIGSPVNETFFWASRGGALGTDRVTVSANNEIGFPAVGNRSQIFTIEGEVVPEPAGLALMSLGAMALIRRRR